MRNLLVRFRRRERHYYETPETCDGVWHVTTPREPRCPKCGEAPLRPRVYPDEWCNICRERVSPVGPCTHKLVESCCKCEPTRDRERVD